MNWELKQAQIQETTRRSLNAERKCVFPPVGDRLDFLEENEDEELEAVGHITNDWTIGLERSDKRQQYFVEVIASRKNELPEEFGQDSYFAIDGIVFHAQEIFRTQSHTDLQQPFVTPSLRPTIKIYCSITKRTFAG